MLRVYIWLSLIFGEMKGLSVGRLSRNIHSDQSHEYTSKHALENFPQFEPKLETQGSPGPRPIVRGFLSLTLMPLYEPLLKGMF